MVRYVAEELERHVTASTVTRNNDIGRQDGEAEDKVRVRGKSILKCTGNRPPVFAESRYRGQNT